ADVRRLWPRSAGLGGDLSAGGRDRRRRRRAPRIAAYDPAGPRHPRHRQAPYGAQRRDPPYRGRSRDLRGARRRRAPDLRAGDGIAPRAALFLVLRDASFEEFMRRAIAVHTRGHWPEEAAVDSVTLAMIDRHRRRIRLVADSGAPFLLDLARAQHLAEGDGLDLDNGNYLRVRAAPEPVIVVAAETPSGLLRIAWHLGNRHLP